jgi:hypothetical protein
MEILKQLEDKKNLSYKVRLSDFFSAYHTVPQQNKNNVPLKRIVVLNVNLLKKNVIFWNDRRSVVVR